MRFGDKFYLKRKPHGKFSHLANKRLTAAVVWSDGSVWPAEEFVLIPKSAVTKWRFIAYISKKGILKHE